MSLGVGVARTRLSPFWGVELAGWGYYLNRTWERVRDHTAATAVVIDDGKHSVALIAVDLMYLDAAFTRAVREQVTAATGMPPHAICVGCSHSHNTPTAALIRGAGEVDPAYVAWAARQAATAAILAWRQREPAQFRVGRTEVGGWSYNRTRENGPVDTRLSVWRFDGANGSPLAAVVNFQAHPTIMMSLGARHVSRDAPGIVTDELEKSLPRLTALYLQGSCGDVNFGDRWNNPPTCWEPGRHVAAQALSAFSAARQVENTRIAAVSTAVNLPTRRWTREEVMRDREEGLYRLRTGDTTGWRENIGRVMVNYPDRFPERYGGSLELAVKAIARFAVEWTEEVLKDLDTRPETLSTEVQAIRIGDAYLVTDGAELFTSIALNVRRQCPHDDLMIVGYANESIGYLPDQHDLERRTYAADQSPKFKNQFPFVAESAQVMAAGMIQALSKLWRR
jgi:hypothetical protein